MYGCGRWAWNIEQMADEVSQYKSNKALIDGGRRERKCLVTAKQGERALGLSWLDPLCP